MFTSLEPMMLYTNCVVLYSYESSEQAVWLAGHPQVDEELQGAGLPSYLLSSLILLEAWMSCRPPFIGCEWLNCGWCFILFTKRGWVFFSKLGTKLAVLVLTNDKDARLLRSQKQKRQWCFREYTKIVYLSLLEGENYRACLRINNGSPSG